MKIAPILWQSVANKPVNRLLTFLLICVGLMASNTAHSQCATGQNRVTLNWDILDFFMSTGSYAVGASDDYIENAATQSYIQNFAFGSSNRLTVTTGSNIVLGGEVNTHTGELTNYTGDDVMFTPNSNNQTITLTFETAIENVSFTIYDIERNQILSVAAADGITPRPMTVGLQTGSILTVGGIFPLPRTITASNTSSAANSNTGSATINVAGPVRTITITFSSIGGSNTEIYLSDIAGCVTTNFPTNYYAVAQPWTGQPGYVLHAFDRSVYYVNPANGFTRRLFTDNQAASNGNVNSMGYDPYNRFLYYVYSLSSSGGKRKMLRKYDVNTDVQSTILNDLEDIGIATTDITGAESGSASFYNGSYYIGIETFNSDRNSGREATIWRVDFNGSNVPYRSSQVFAQLIDSAGFLLHDWSDFVIHNGVLFNFDAAENDREEVPGGGPTLTPAQRNQSDIYHVNLMTGDFVRYRKPGLSSGGWYPGQPAINWAGQALQVFASSGSADWPGAMPGSLPYITNYNGNGTIGTPVFMNSAPAFTPASPSLGDAGEAFRPRSDFGDAPASYDPDPQGPATHEIDPLLRLGSSIAIEWTRTPNATALGEGGAGGEENGVGGTNPLNMDATLTYSTQNISVFNNTGANARLIVWLDYDFNGVFDPSEGRAVNVPTSASAQNVVISWNNIFVPLTTNTMTFMRIRLARAIDNMTVNNSSGWIGHGEVEDFNVVMGSALPKDLQAFNVKKQANSSVDVKWTINEAEPVENFDVMRSTDNTNWTKIGTIASQNGVGMKTYTYVDHNPAPGKSYYRMRINYRGNGANKFSEVRSVQFDNSNVFVRVLPNPATEQADVQVNATSKGDAEIRVYDRGGRVVLNLKKAVEAGANSIRITNLSKLADGVYTVRTVVNGRTSSNQLIIKKQ